METIIFDGIAFEAAGQAYNYCLKFGKRIPKLEKMIATDARHSYLYAKYIVKGRFKLGEKKIATDVYYSYWYAKDVIKGRFELGEPIIATNTYYSYRYAFTVIKGRFELGEKLILNSVFAKDYRNLFLK